MAEAFITSGLFSVGLATIAIGLGAPVSAQTTQNGVQIGVDL